jgi:hypothetical protein
MTKGPNCEAKAWKLLQISGEWKFKFGQILKKRKSVSQG